MVGMESPRRSKSSPEFEFWMVGNNLQPPDLHTADELFADGVLLPLHLLSLSSPTSFTGPQSINPIHHPLNNSYTLKLESTVSAEEPSAVLVPPESFISSSSSSSSISSSKRWKDLIFKKKDPSDEKDAKRKERKNSKSGGGAAAAELNIYIWPFSRSRSAGSAAAGRPRPTPVAGRKSSSAPCSRSNSGGGGGRRWAASPGRPGGGVHVGRASPVWRRPAKAGPTRRSTGLNLNVNGCIGYRISNSQSQMSCRGEEDDDDGRVGGSLSRFRAFFSKKVY